MTRVIDMDAGSSPRPGQVRLLAELADTPRTVRRKPRDPVEDELLLRSAVEAVRRRTREGRLVRVAPRTYDLLTAEEARRRVR